MPDLSIGLSGLNVARTALETVGNNMANAATDGYHRQEVRISPISEAAGSTQMAGRGAEISGITRLIDNVAENEMLRQQPMLAQTSQELGTLQSVESVVGDMTTGGLGSAITNFFGSLTQLASDPKSAVLRDQVVWAGDSVSTQFRNVTSAVQSLGESLQVQAQTLIGQVNTLTKEMADLNSRISELYSHGVTDNNLLDRRDADVQQLGQLIGADAAVQPDGSVNLSSAGNVLVMGTNATTLVVGRTFDNQLGISVAGAANYNTQIAGGQVGGVLALTNQILPGLTGSLDGLAGELIQRINGVHVQGLGTGGSFSQLEGQSVNGDLGAWQPPLAAGTVYVRITDTATGVTVRKSVAIDPAADTLSDVAARFNALGGLTARVTDSRLNIQADPGKKFDFLPAVLPDPAASTLTGTATPTFSGAYTGEANQSFTFTVVGTGSVGVTPGLTLAVTDASGNPVKRIVVGAGYAAGDALDASSGIGLALSVGTLKDGETFTVDALASSDTSGFLAGAGLNTFFTGNSAATISVAGDLKKSSDRLATASGADGADNSNAMLMGYVGDEQVDSLGGMTLGDAFRHIVADLGQQVALRQAAKDGYQNAMTQLQNQRDNVSGVDLNQEAANLLMYQQLFQSMAKYISISDQAQQALFNSI
jgi:flagellar hook-associated protein 1